MTTASDHANAATAPTKPAAPTAPEPLTAPPQRVLGDGVVDVSPDISEPLPLALIGPTLWRDRFRQIFESLPNRKVWAPRPSLLRLPARPFAAAAISMSRSYTIFDGIERLRRRVGTAPIIAVVPTDIQGSAVRQMFEKGANTIVAWPDEAFVLKSLLVMAQSDSASDGAESERSVDEAIAAGIRQRLEIQFVNAPVDVSVDQTTCRLDGVVQSLLRKMEVISLAENVPGISRVNADSLVVNARPVDESELTSDVRLALRMNERIDASTLCAAASEDGQVTLTGTAANEKERHRAQRTIAAVPGVSALVDLTTQSHSQKEHDRRAYQRAERALNAVLETSDDVRLSIFGKVGFVSGRVKTTRIKTAVEKAIQRVTQVKRVINEVQVQDAPR